MIDHRSADHARGHNPPFEGPLLISSLDLPGGAALGLTNCPGRTGLDGEGRAWRRDLGPDLGAIEDWRAARVLTLLEAGEFATYDVPDLAENASRRRFQWHHLPIRDMQAPAAAFAAAWQADGPAILEDLRSGARIVLHCASGLGRTGTLAAKLLMTLGAAATADDAVRQVRQARPGAIETDVQLAYLRDGPPLLQLDHYCTALRKVT